MVAENTRCIASEVMAEKQIGLVLVTIRCCFKKGRNKVAALVVDMAQDRLYTYTPKIQRLYRSG